MESGFSTNLITIEIRTGRLIDIAAIGSLIVLQPEAMNAVWLNDVDGVDLVH